MSDLDRHLNDYLTVRRALGFKLVGRPQLLGEFVAFLSGRAAHDHHAVRAGVGQAPDRRQPQLPVAAAASGPRVRAVPARAGSATCEVPPIDLLPAEKYRAAPYLYRDEEILALMAGRG